LLFPKQKTLAMQRI